MRIKECISETNYVCIHSDSSHGHYIIPMLSDMISVVSKSEARTLTAPHYVITYSHYALRIDIFATLSLDCCSCTECPRQSVQETSCCGLQYFHWNCAVPSQYPSTVSSDGNGQTEDRTKCGTVRVNLFGARTRCLQTQRWSVAATSLCCRYECKVR